MHYGIVMSNLGDYADPLLAIRLARAAEEAEWEAFFVWDHLGFVWGSASSDPWISLSAVAVSTTHLKRGRLTEELEPAGFEMLAGLDLPSRRPSGAKPSQRDELAERRRQKEDRQ